MSIKRRQKQDRFSWGLMIVVTKCDKRAIIRKYEDNKEERLEFVKQYQIPYVEISVNHRMNINFVFRQAIYEYWIQSQLLPFIT